MPKATYKGKYLSEDLLTISECESVTVTFMVKDMTAGKAVTVLEQ